MPIPAVALVLLSVLLVVVATAAAARVTAGLGATVVDKLFRSGLRARLEARIEAWGAWLKRNARAVSVRLTKPVFGALIAATVPAERFMHRAAVRALLPFLASRPVVTGTGSLDENGAFHLSERAAFVDRVHMSLWFDLSSTIRQMRALDDDDRSPAPRASRGLTKTKALMNGGMQILELDFRTWRRLFRRRQRLELTSSDANRAQVAELLKVGTTMLVLDMHEAGVLDDAPVLRDPIAALKAVSADPTLTVQVPLVDGRALTALEIQRFYCERAARWIEEQPAVSLEAKRVVELWQSVLDGLARDPQSLVGVLDWPTKKMLLDTAGQGLGPDERKKIDIRYHELGAGYFERFVERGLARTVVDPGAVAEAVTTPPQDTPATVRGRLIREAKTLGTPLVDVDWEHVVLKDQHTGRKRFVVLRGGRD